jgi:CRISPR type III-B/RAMP module-associated protein Cmr3
VGLLRHILFLAGKDAGDSSFQPDYQPAQGLPNHQTFGDLLGISPLYLSNGDAFLAPAAKLWHSNTHEVVADFSQPERTIKGMMYRETFNDLPDLSFYSAKESKVLPYTDKEWRGNFWIDTDRGHKIAEDDIFLSNFHIGIDKANRMDTGNDIDAFYKQEYYQLAQGYAFAVVATVNDPVPTSTFNCTMPFGGENRSFIVKATDLTAAMQKKLDPIAAYGNRLDRVVLQSDCYVPTDELDALYAHCRLVVADSKPFRSIMVKGNPKTNSKDVYRNLHKEKRRLRYLLERGSVLFPKEGRTNAVLDLLAKPANYQNIGYNHTFPHRTFLKSN